MTRARGGAEAAAVVMSKTIAVSVRSAEAEKFATVLSSRMSLVKDLILVNDSKSQQS